MTTDLPTPDKWLNEQLEKLHITQNEFARRHNISSSALSNFTSGQCGAQTAVNIANALGVPATYTLALVGKVPPPPAQESANADLISHIYQRLDEQRQAELLSFAEYLRAQSKR